MTDHDELEMRAHAVALADGLERAIGPWVERCVDRVHRAWSGPPPPEVAAAATSAGHRARADLGPRLRALLEADSDAQRSTPLALIREGTAYPTKVLRDAGVPGVPRDPMDTAMFPDDVYGLAPASLADVEPGLGELGIAWGAAKAWVHRRRHG